MRKGRLNNPKTFQATVRVDAKRIAEVTSGLILAGWQNLTKADIVNFALSYTAESMIQKERATPFLETEQAIKFLESQGLDPLIRRSTFKSLRDQILQEEKEDLEVGLIPEVSPEKEEEIKERLKEGGL